jgi:ACS family glucarate transporter-like MFS transporter
MMSPAWATAQDIGRRYAAIVSGAMNMVGNLGAVLGLLVTGRILKQYAGPDGTTDPAGFVICFVLYAVVYAGGVGMWLLIDPTKPAVEDGA